MLRLSRIPWIISTWGTRWTCPSTLRCPPTLATGSREATTWCYNILLAGEYYWQPNGTLWGVGDEQCGPGMSFRFTIDLGSNSTALQQGAAVNGSVVKTILPRTLRALSDGPVPTTTPNKWRTGFSGSIAFLTPDNDLFEVNIDTPAICNISRLSQQVLARWSHSDRGQHLTVGSHRERLERCGKSCHRFQCSCGDIDSSSCSLTGTVDHSVDLAP
jgi:hypothetical protein